MALIINRNLLHCGQALKYDLRDVMCFYEAVKHMKWIFYVSTCQYILLASPYRTQRKKDEGHNVDPMTTYSNDCVMILFLSFFDGSCASLLYSTVALFIFRKTPVGNGNSCHSTSPRLPTSKTCVFGSAVEPLHNRMLVSNTQLASS